MHPTHHLVGLPASLLALISLSNPALCQAAEPQWPYNLPPHVKYYPEDELLIRRNTEIQEKLEKWEPQFLRKMGNDPEEMFFLDYWGFEETDNQAPLLSTESRVEESGEWANTTLLSNPHPHPALRLHGDVLPAISPRWLLHKQKRSFTCPTGTTSCTNINRPNSCCKNGLTCNIVADTGLGDVGCCADSNSCGGQSSSCPVDYEACPSSQGGGCCIPGYACAGEGCVLTSTTVIVISPTPTSTTTSTSTSSSASTSTTSSATVVTTTTSKTATTTCSSGFKSCASSLGGGCCASDRVCGSHTCAPASTKSSTPSAVAPVRPTSDITSTSSPISTPTSSTASVCPQNFYACSAYYPGAGCCQVGRDCSSTSCPGRTTSTALVSNGVTVVQQPTTGVCASSWSSCGANVGGGCCPIGYACGTASCSATGTAASGTSTKAVVKQNGVAPMARTIWCGLRFVGMFWFVVFMTK